MDLLFSARSTEQANTDYESLDKHGLDVKSTIISGDGKPNNPFKVNICIHNNNQNEWSGVIHIELPFSKRNPRFFLPAFMYGKNRGESPQNVLNEFPRLREQLSKPSSPWWMVRSDRLSHPVALVFDEGMIYGLSASPYFIMDDTQKQPWNTTKNQKEFYQYAGFTCSLSKGTIGYTLGYENAPWLFIQSHKVLERAALSENCFTFLPGESITLNLYLYQYYAENEQKINEVIKHVYYEYHQLPREKSDVKTTVFDLSQAIFKDGWVDEDLNYSTFIKESKKDDSYDYLKIMNISWTTGLSVATPVLIASLRLGNESMRKQALTCIENVVQNSLNPMSGLPYDAYDNGKWSVKGWWFDGMHTRGHSSYLVGQAMFYILRAYEYEKKLKNCIHDHWLTFVKNILQKIEKTKNTDHEYPYIFSEKSGAGIEYDAFSGTWCMAALAYYSYLTKETAYIDSLMESEKYYYEAYVARMECYGTPLDTDKAIDSEGILAYIKAVRYIHELTQDNVYLQHMRDAFSYEFSFKFCYNSPIKIPPLSTTGWSSCGGSVTSTANPHIHPMSSNIVGEMQYYIEKHHDTYIQNRLMDTVLWGCQTYNTFDREFDFGKKGWMSERFCYCEGLVTERYPDDSPASTWFNLMPWASASIIDGLVGDYWDIMK